MTILLFLCVGKRENGGNGLTILLFTHCHRISTAQHQKLCKLLSTLPSKATLALLRNTQLTLLGQLSCTLLENMWRTSTLFLCYLIAFLQPIIIKQMIFFPMQVRNSKSHNNELKTKRGSLSISLSAEVLRLNCRHFFILKEFSTQWETCLCRLGNAL